MNAIGILLATGLVLVIGRFLVRRLGFLQDAATAVKWGAVLLASAILFAHFRGRGGAGGSRSTTDSGNSSFLLLPLVLALALIGQRWLRARLDDRKEDRTASQQRQRALPPPPAAPPPGAPPPPPGPDHPPLV